MIFICPLTSHGFQALCHAFYFTTPARRVTLICIYIEKHQDYHLHHKLLFIFCLEMISSIIWKKKEMVLLWRSALCYQSLCTALSALCLCNGVSLASTWHGWKYSEVCQGEIVASRPLTGDQVKALLILSAGFNLAGQQIQSHRLPVGLDKENGQLLSE